MRPISKASKAAGVIVMLLVLAGCTVVKALGMVNAPPDFTEHPQVINGFSELMIQVFGERGQHARSAVGVASLPWNLAVEVEMIVQVRK